MSLRQAVGSDLELVLAITREAYEPYVPILGGLPLPLTEDYVPWIDRGQVWLAERNGTVAGLMVLEPREQDLLIFSLAVAPAHQGQGVGRSMIDAAEALATTAGLSSLRLYTSDRMTRNIAIYGLAGFHETGRRPNPYREGWVLVDMMKPLPAVQPAPYPATPRAP